jgi:antitoxin component YwqK of YwqJK toxin-antitoxin module
MAILIKKPNEEYYAIISDGIEIKEGEYKEYYNDILKVLCYYTNNKLNGKYIIFNNDNTINKVSNYINGILEGEEIQYYEYYGKKNIRKSYYNNGKLHGKSKLFNGDEKLEWSVIYDNGEIIRPYKKHNQCNIL